PDFNVEDSVFIIKKIWSTDRLSNKLDFLFICTLYKIVDRAGYSYVLEVLAIWRGLKVFYIDCLRKDLGNLLLG
ncbi:hypothetical protein QBC45DRAFT_340475, partial [Copromyces sp. CBS 386.78]